MRIVGIDSYNHDLPLARLLQDAVVLPIFDGGNMGVRRLSSTPCSEGPTTTLSPPRPPSSKPSPTHPTRRDRPAPDHRCNRLSGWLRPDGIDTGGRSHHAV
ncbi:hypothetical protein [Rhodococcus opacus]|uniref:hypothetical protein n=1 Tax=Rhodococcus opacus TaxID=37919 RepID=UPI0035577817